MRIILVELIIDLAVVRATSSYTAHHVCAKYYHISTKATLHLHHYANIYLGTHRKVLLAPRGNKPTATLRKTTVLYVEQERENSPRPHRVCTI